MIQEHTLYGLATLGAKEKPGDHSRANGQRRADEQRNSHHRDVVSREERVDVWVCGDMLQTCSVLTNVSRSRRASQGKRVFRAVCRYLGCGMIWYEATLVLEGETDIYTCS
jgi:hypothetical protein